MQNQRYRGPQWQYANNKAKHLQKMQAAFARPEDADREDQDPPEGLQPPPESRSFIDAGYSDMPVSGRLYGGGCIAIATPMTGPTFAGGAS